MDVINKYTMNDRVLDALRSIVEEEDMHVLIEEGGTEVDYNGDRQIDVWLSYAPEDADTVSDAVVRAINSDIGILLD